MIENQVVVRAFVEENGRPKIGEDEKKTMQTFYNKYLGKSIYIILSPFRGKRSDEQNDYYWPVIIRLISKATGNDEDDLHEYLKSKFSTERKVRLGGNDYVVTRSTKKLNTIEFNEYCEKCRQWAAEKEGIYIPLPNECFPQQGYEDFSL